MFKTPNCTIIFVLMLFVAKNRLKSTQFSFHIARTNSYLFFLDFEVIKSILEIFKPNTSLLNKFLFRLSFKGSWLILFKCSLISFGLSFNTCISICIGHRQIEFLERIGVQFKEHSSSSHAVFSTEKWISLKKRILTCFFLLSFTFFSTPNQFQFSVSVTSNTTELFTEWIYFRWLVELGTHIQRRGEFVLKS